MLHTAHPAGRKLAFALGLGMAIGTWTVAASADQYRVDTDADQLSITRNGVLWRTGTVIDGKASFTIGGDWVLGAGDVVRGEGALPASFLIGDDVRIDPGATLDFSGIRETPGAGGGDGGVGGVGGAGGAGGAGGSGGGTQWVRGGGAFVFFFGAAPPPVPGLNGKAGSDGGNGAAGQAGVMGSFGGGGFQNTAPLAAGGVGVTSSSVADNFSAGGVPGVAAPYWPSPVPFSDKDGGFGGSGSVGRNGAQGATGGSGEGGRFLPASDNAFDLVAGNGGGGGAGGQGGQGGGGGGGGGGGAAGQGSWATVLVPPLPPTFTPGWNFAGFAGAGGPGSDGGAGGLGATGERGGDGGAGGGAAEFFAQGNITLNGTADASGGRGTAGQPGLDPDAPNDGFGSRGDPAGEYDSATNQLVIAPIPGVQTYPGGLIAPTLLPNAFGGIGGSGQAGGLGGPGGDGGAGGGGSGGTIKLVGTGVSGSGLVDVGGGLGADNTVSFDDGEAGRLLVGTNTAAAGSSAIGSLGGATLNGNDTATQTGTFATNPLIARETFVPTLAGLTRGAEAFGLTSLNTLDLELEDGSSLIQATPQNAFAGVARYDAGPAGFDVEYAGYDLLLLFNARAETLLDPKLGITAPDATGGTDPLLDIGRENFLTELLDGGWQTDARFGGTGDTDVDSLAGFDVYATLVPEGVDYLFNFAVTSGESILSAERQTLANGELFFVTSSPDVPVLDASWVGSNSVWSDAANWGLVFNDTGQPPTGSETPTVPGIPANSADYAFNIFIGQDVDVTADISVTVDQLNIGAGDAVTIATDRALAIERFAVRTDSGKINNEGEIFLSGGSAGASRLLISGSGLMLDGSGRLHTSLNPNNIIAGIRPGDSLVQFADHTIEANGQLGGGTLAITNHGTIRVAPIAGGLLEIDPDGDATRSRAAFVNHGLVETNSFTDLDLVDGFFRNEATSLIAVEAGNDTLTLRDARLHNEGTIRVGPNSTLRMLSMNMLTGNDLQLDPVATRVEISGGLVNETVLNADLEILDSVIVNTGGRIGGPGRLDTAAPLIDVTNASITGGEIEGEFSTTGITLKNVTIRPETYLTGPTLGLAGTIDNQIAFDPSGVSIRGIEVDTAHILEDTTLVGGGWFDEEGFNPSFATDIRGSGDTNNPSRLTISPGVVLPIGESLGGFADLTVDNRGVITDELGFEPITDITANIRNAGVIRSFADELFIAGEVDNAGGLIEADNRLSLDGRVVGGTIRAADYVIDNAAIDGTRIESQGGSLFFDLTQFFGTGLRIDNTTIAADTSFLGNDPSDSFVTLGGGIKVEQPARLSFDFIDVSFQSSEAFRGDGTLQLFRSFLSSPQTLRFAEGFTVQAFGDSEIGADFSVIENRGTIAGDSFGFVLNPAGDNASADAPGLINRGMIAGGVVEGGWIDNRGGVLDNVSMAGARVVGGTLRDFSVEAFLSSEFPVDLQGEELFVLEDVTLEGTASVDSDVFMELAGDIRNDADVDFSNASTDLLDDVRLSGTGRLIDPLFLATGQRLTNEAGHTIEFTDASVLDLTDVDMPEIINYGTVLLAGDVAINEVIETQVLPAGSTVPDLSDPENDPDAVTVLTEDTPYDVLRAFKNYGTLETPGLLSVTDNAIQNEGVVRASGITLSNAEILGDEDSSVDLGGNTLAMIGQSTLSGGSILNAAVRVSSSVQDTPASISSIDLNGSSIEASSYVELGGSVENIGTLRVDRAVGDVPVVLIGNADTTVDVGTTIVNAGKIKLSAGTLATDTIDFDAGSTQTTPGLDWTGGTLRLEQQVFETAPGGIFGDRVDLLTGMTLETPQGVRVAAASTLGLGGGALTTPSIENNGVVELGVGDASTNLAAHVTGAGVLRKVGTGTAVVSGTNTHTGGTEIAGGWLEAPNLAALGDSTSPVRFSGGDLRLTGADLGGMSRDFQLEAFSSVIEVADPDALLEALVSPASSAAASVIKSGPGNWRHAAMLDLNGGSLRVEGGLFDATGQDLDLQGPDGTNGSGTNGARGGAVSLFQGDASASRVLARGGDGGNGANGTSFSVDGQTGGRGGDGRIVSVGLGRLVVSSLIDLRGGDGGNGGNGTSSFLGGNGEGGDAGDGGNGGDVSVSSGGVLDFTTGVIDLRGGRAGFRGSGSSAPSGRRGIDGDDGELGVFGGTLITTDSQLDNQIRGDFTFSSGTIRFTDASFDPSGSLRLSNALGGSSKTLSGGRGLAFDNTLVINSNQSLTLTNGGTLTAATIDHTQGGSFSFTGGTLAAGTFNGDLTQDNGTFDVGPGVNGNVGLATVTGAYQANAGSLRFQLGGISRGNEYDALNTLGGLSLNGADLDIEVLPGFAPSLGDRFDIITSDTAASIVGVFETVTTNLAGATRTFAVSYDDETIAAISAVFGDANLDQRVSFADFQTLQGNFGLPGTWEDGDFDQNGIVTFADFELLEANFGYDIDLGGIGPISTEQVAALNAFTIANVPEPTTLVLLAVGGLGLLSHRPVRRAGRRFPF